MAADAVAERSANGPDTKRGTKSASSRGSEWNLLLRSRQTCTRKHRERGRWRLRRGWAEDPDAVRSPRSRCRDLRHHGDGHSRRDGGHVSVMRDEGEGEHDRLADRFDACAPASPLEAAAGKAAAKLRSSAETSFVFGVKQHSALATIRIPSSHLVAAGSGSWGAADVFAPFAVSNR